MYVIYDCCATAGHLVSWATVREVHAHVRERLPERTECVGKFPVRTTIAYQIVICG